MTEMAYREAIQMLRSDGIDFDYHFPKDEETLTELENALGYKLPKSYKIMLREHGILGFEGQDIFGLGLQDLEARSPFNFFTAPLWPERETRFQIEC